VEWCPSRDDGWGEIACLLGPAVTWWQGRPKDCSASFSNPILEGPLRRVRREARARERHRTLARWMAWKRL